VRITAGSREVPGKKRPVTRDIHININNSSSSSSSSNNNNNNNCGDYDDDDDDDDDNNNNNNGPSHTNKKLPEIYFEAAKHQQAVKKMWKRIGDNPTHYCSM